MFLDTLHSTIKEITDIANNLEVDYFFALSRRKLGVITLKHVPISCIGIFNYDGAQVCFLSVCVHNKTFEFYRKNIK